MYRSLLGLEGNHFKKEHCCWGIALTLYFTIYVDENAFLEIDCRHIILKSDNLPKYPSDVCRKSKATKYHCLNLIHSGLILIHQNEILIEYLLY